MLDCTTTSYDFPLVTNGVWTDSNGAVVTSTMMAGTYTLTVTGSNGCSASDELIVTLDNTLPVVDAGADVMLDCTTTSYVFPVVTNGVWTDSNGAVVTSTMMAGTYTLAVTENGCSASDELIVTLDNTLPVVDAGADVMLDCTTTSYDFPVVTNGVWEDSNGAVVTSTMVAGTYTLTVTENGCSASDDLIVTLDNTLPVVDAGADVMLDCTTTSYDFPLVTNGVWTDSNGAVVTSTMMAGTYTLTVTGSNGCSASDELIVTLDNTLPVVDAGADVMLDCTTTSYDFPVVTNGVWTDSNGAVVTSTTMAGTYTLTVTENGCSASDDLIVTLDNTLPVVDAGADVMLDCTTTSYDFPIVTNGVWTDSNGAVVTSTMVAGTYTLTVTENGCSASDELIITLDSTLPDVDAGLDVMLNCSYTTFEFPEVTNGVWTNFLGEALTATSMPGIYTLTIAGANGCTASDQLEVMLDTSLPTVNAGEDVTLDCITTNYDFPAVTNGVWTDENGDIVTSTMMAGTYTLTVTENGCSGSDAIEITVDNTAPEANGGGDVTIACDVSNYNLFELTNGVWYNEAGDIVTSANATGTYTLVVTDPNNGCTDSDDILLIFQGSTPIVDAGVDVVLDCNNETYVFPEIENGVWTNDENEIVSSTSEGGTYTLTVILPGGCSDSDELNISVDNELPMVDAGGDITVACGASFYNFPEIENGFWTNEDGDLVTSTSESGKFTLHIIGENGCEGIDTITILIQGDYPVVDAGEDVELDCNITSFDFPPFENGYWTNEAGVVVNSTSEEGTYTLTIQTSTGCEASDFIVVSLDNIPPDVDSGGDVTLGCGVTNFNFPEIEGGTWTDINGIVVTQAFGAGIFTLSLTGENGCTGSDSMEIFVTEEPVIDAGGDITLGCGVVNFNFPEIENGVWTNEAGEAITSTSEAGVYTITVNDGFGCIATDVLEIFTLGELPVIDAGEDVILNCTNSVYEFPLVDNGIWTNEASEIVSSTTEAGTYTLTVTSGSCTAIDMLEVVLDTDLPIADAGDDITLDCDVETYMFPEIENAYWTNEAGETVTEAITVGIYFLNVIGENGCIGSDDKEIFALGNTPEANAGDDIILDCITTEFVFPEIENGVWTNEADEIITSTSEAGTYTLTVTTETGCSASDMMMVNSEIELPDVDTGGDLTLGCGVANYTFPEVENGVWTNEAGDIITSTGEAGIYTLTITDENGCSASDTQEIFVTEEPMIDAGGDITLGCGVEQFNFPVIDNGTWTNANGEIITQTSEAGVYTLTVSNQFGCIASDELEIFTLGGVPDVDAGEDIVLDCNNSVYTFPEIENGVWTDATGDAVLSTSLEGTYTLIVSSENACSSSDDMNITLDNEVPEVDAGGDITLDCGSSSYELDNSSGGTWTNDSGSVVSIALSSGVYTLTVTAENGCSASDDLVVVFSNELPDVDAGGDITLDCGVETFTFPIVENGVWINEGGQVITETSTGGLYTLSVTDASGCIGTDDIYIFVSGNTPNVDAGDDITLSCGDTYTFPDVENGIWTDENGNEVTATTNSGSFTLTVNADNGCSASDVLLVEIANGLPNVDAGGDITLDCGVAAFNFPEIEGGIWTDESGEEVTSTSSAGIFTLTVTDESGCSGSDEIEIFLSGNLPVVDAGEDITLGCNETYALPEIENGVWSNESGSIVSMALSSGIYTLTVTNGNGCSASDEISIEISNELANVVAGGDITLDCGVAAFNFPEVEGGVWTDENGSSVTSTSMAGTFTLTVTDESGCFGSDAMEVFLSGNLPNVDAGGDITLDCGVSTFNFPEVEGGVWTDENGSVVTSTSSAGIFTLTVTDESGCFGSDVMEVFLSGNLPDVDAGEDVSIFCDDIYVFPEVENGVWTNENGEVITATNGSGVFTLTVSSNGCSSSDSINVAISNNLPGIEDMDFEVCDDDSAINLIELVQDFIGEHDLVTFNVANVINFDPQENTVVNYVVYLNGCSTIGTLNFIVSDCSVDCSTPINCGYAEYCTEPLTELIFCPEFCEEGIEITDFQSFYKCSIEILPDGCISYMPLPGMEIFGYDIVTLEGVNQNGECIEFVVQIGIGDCEELCENPAMEMCIGPMEPIVICPEFCAFDDDSYQITDIQSIYHCSIWQMDDYCFRYTGIPGFVGQDILEITATGADGTESSLIIYLNISENCEIENTNPIANNDEYITTQGESITIDILGNDIDEDGDELTICSHDMPENGFIQLVNGEFIFYPDPWFVGITSFNYTACDGNGGTSSAVVLITVEQFDCTNDILELCTPPLTGMNICPEFCHFANVNDEYEIFDVESIYGCSVEIINNSCVAYIPLPGLTGETDRITIFAQNADGVVSELEVHILISPNCENASRLGVDADECSNSPDIFNPEGFGTNDILTLLNSNYCYDNEDFVLNVFNISGQKVAHYEGTFGSEPIMLFETNVNASGTYVYSLVIKESDVVLNGRIVKIE